MSKILDYTSALVADGRARHEAFLEKISRKAYKKVIAHTSGGNGGVSYESFRLGFASGYGQGIADAK
jgi:hypothetical protein